MSTMKLFGVTGTFAIRYRFNEEAKTPEAAQNLAYCHLIVNNNLVGYADEPCYLKTWIYYLTQQAEFIRANKDKLFPMELNGFTDREILESILMANQEPEDLKKSGCICQD